MADFGNRDDLRSKLRGSKQKAEIFLLILQIVGWETLRKLFRHLTHPLEALAVLNKPTEEKLVC